MLSLLKNLRLLYREHGEFRVFVSLFVAIAITLAILDIIFQPEPGDILVEAHGTLIDLFVVGIIGAVFLYYRFRPVGSFAYYKMLQTAFSCLDKLSDIDDNNRGYNFGKYWLLGPDISVTEPTPIDPWRTRTQLLEFAAHEIAELDRLSDSNPAQRDPEVAIGILDLRNSLVRFEKMLPLGDEFDKTVTETSRKCIVRHAIALAKICINRADEQIPEPELRERYQKIIARRNAT